VIVAVVLAVVALAVAAAAIVVVSHRSAAPKAPPDSVQRPVTVTVPATTPVASGASPSALAVTSAGMRAVLQRYVDAYSNEDIRGLQSLFASDLVRQNGSDPSEDLTQALATYHGQFAALTNPRYTLTNIAYRPGSASATGMYSISSGSGSVRGQIAFHFVRVEDSLLIDEILIRPSS
jgi:hypothetical protein